MSFTSTLFDGDYFLIVATIQKRFKRRPVGFKKLDDISDFREQEPPVLSFLKLHLASSSHPEC